MRGMVLITVSALALGLFACSPKTPASHAAPPAPASEAPPPLPTASAPAPEAPQAAPVSPETTAAAPPAGQAAADPPYRFSPRDFPRQERRISALIANAESRDTLGETPQVAAYGRQLRERCATRRCVEAAYAAEAAHLRKWEGSGDIR